MNRLSPKTTKILSVAGALVVLVIIYFHHFHIGFQIDDAYFIQDNAAIRSLKNIPAIFTDSRTESSLPIFQGQYRPLFILSFAIDYYIANGVNPVVIHIHTFIGFIVLVFLCFLLNLKIFKHLLPAPFYPALLATCCFAFHPVTADVVNYMTARSNIFGTLYGMLYMITWLYVPFFKRNYLYLIPLIIGCLFKITALMFIPLLWLYIIYFEYDTGFNMGFFKALKSSFKTMLPALIVGPLVLSCQGLTNMHSAGYVQAASQINVTLFTNLLTQSHVLLRYFLLFIMPENLNPYGRHPFITSPFDYRFLVGFVFIIGALFIIYLFSLRKSTRAISYGLAWFFICMLPTSSFIPFVSNYVEYYMFATVIGLSLAVASVIVLFVNHLKTASRFAMPVIIGGCLFFLCTLAYGSHDRVRIWGNNKAMLDDVLYKDPTNGHMLVNQGVYYMGKGKWDSATNYFDRSIIYLPNYDLAYLNLGILSTVLHDTAAATTNFQKSLTLNDYYHAQTCYYYASFLHIQHEDEKAATLLSTALKEAPAYREASDLLKEINAHMKAGKDTTVASIIEKSNLTEADYIKLSLAYFNKGDYNKSIEACQEILAIDSNSALAYNNMCAAYNALHQWDAAIDAGNKAIRIKPDFALARNNVNFALSQKKINK
jgi:Tfp pilus assembly protein PilF